MDLERIDRESLIDISSHRKNLAFPSICSLGVSCPIGGRHVLEEAVP